VKFSLQANVSGTICGHHVTFGRAWTEFTFVTRNFTEPAGFHHVSVTWTLRYLVDLKASGGRVGHPRPASAEDGIGMNGAVLCDRSIASCT